MKTITVKAVPGGWIVDQTPDGMPLMFLGGGRAEQKARELAKLISRGGESAQVAVHDRGGRLVGQFHYEAEAIGV
ncbi:MAG: hypothetical protein ACK4YQ_15445 [Phenylobacterium sp.]|uniref:hypothetical protein n=1 Tax=Phenylobacterium sp. TaxID=1871053 RepID=UPI00391AC602